MENLPTQAPLKEMKVRNPKTKAIHGREFWAQIIFPSIIILFGSGLLITWLVINKVGTAKVWAEITVILTTLPILIFGVVIIGLLAGLIYLAIVLNREIPPLTYKTQRAIFKIKDQVERGADISAKPVIQIRSYLATIEAFFALFRGKHE